MIFIMISSFFWAFQGMNYPTCILARQPGCARDIKLIWPESRSSIHRVCSHGGIGFFCCPETNNRSEPQFKILGFERGDWFSIFQILCPIRVYYYDYSTLLDEVVSFYCCSQYKRVDERNLKPKNQLRKGKRMRAAVRIWEFTEGRLPLTAVPMISSISINNKQPFQKTMKKKKHCYSPLELSFPFTPFLRWLGKECLLRYGM